MVPIWLWFLQPILTVRGASYFMNGKMFRACVQSVHVDIWVGWLLGFYDSTRDKDDMTVGVGHSRRYCNTVHSSVSDIVTKEVSITLHYITLQKPPELEFWNWGFKLRISLRNCSFYRFSHPRTNRVRRCLSSFLSDLHWLFLFHPESLSNWPCSHAILFTNQPSYLADMISPYQPPRNLRISTMKKLAVPGLNGFHTVMSRRAFCFEAPELWNGLPPDVTDLSVSMAVFRSRLKTHLFRTAFDS